MPTKLVIYGSCYLDLLKLVSAINRVDSTWEIAGFLDDRPETHGSVIAGLPVIGGRDRLSELVRHEDIAFFNNVSGEWSNARKIAETLARHQCRIASLVHPGVDLELVSIGAGCILPDGCIVGSGTHIGEFLSARLHVVISHEVRIGNFVFLGPGCVIGSEVTIEDGAFLGASVTVTAGTRIGAGAIIGAGSLVRNDVLPGVTMSGNPARLVARSGRSEDAAAPSAA